jgi:hypothetical protein
MKRLCLVVLAGLASTQALAVGQLADVSITDRDTGETLKAHRYRGEYWVAGRPGAHYAINIRSQHGQRLLAVTSVDGINVITGDTARFDQRGYVFDPYVGYDIAGWRKSSQQIAAFEFTSIPKSYAARTGRPDHVGVIGVALFRERVPVAYLEDDYDRAQPVSPAPVAKSAAGAANESAAQDSSSASAAPQSERRERMARAPSLGTGHGRRESSVVTHVDFVREQREPNEIIRIRYDSYSNLLAMGVIKRSPPAQRWPRAFPDEAQLGYVPDP